MLELMMRYPVPALLRPTTPSISSILSPPPRVAFEAIDLPMCKIIVNKHGGAINVALEAPEELVIRISLPFSDDRPKGVLIADK